MSDTGTELDADVGHPRRRDGADGTVTDDGVAADDRVAADDSTAVDDGSAADDGAAEDGKEDGVSALAERGSDHGDAADPSAPDPSAPGPAPLDPSDDLPGGRPDGNVPAEVDTDSGEPAPARLTDRRRESFGRHLEAHYARLVGQMFAITLDAQEAHDAVQDAYARAWRTWDDLVEHDDPTRWVLRVAVSGTTRSWRSLLSRVGLYRHPLPPLEDVSPRTAALIGALYRLSPAERRAVVMFHMAGATTAEIAALERTSIDKVSGRLSRARLVVTEDMVDVFLDVLGPGAPTTRRV